MTAPVDLTAAMYKTLLLGMKPAKTYHFRVVATDASQTYTSDDQTVTTGAKTTLVSLSSFTVKDATKVDKGFFVSSFWQGSGAAVPFIFDSDGDVVWWYAKGSGETTDGISRARMSADAKNIWLVNEKPERQSAPARQHRCARGADVHRDQGVARHLRRERRHHGVPRLQRERLQQHLRDHRGLDRQGQ